MFCVQEGEAAEKPPSPSAASRPTHPSPPITTAHPPPTTPTPTTYPSPPTPAYPPPTPPTLSTQPSPPTPAHPPTSSTHPPPPTPAHPTPPVPTGNSNEVKIKKEMFCVQAGEAADTVKDASKHATEASEETKTPNSWTLFKLKTDMTRKKSEVKRDYLSLTKK